MKRMLTCLLAAVMLATGLPAAAGEAPYNYNDTRTFTVRLPQGERTGLLAIATGKWLIPPQFEAIKLDAGNTELLEKYDSLLAVKVDGKWGFADKTGQVVIAARYKNAWNFTDSLYRVASDEGIGIIDATGRMVTGPRFAGSDRMSEGMAVVEENGRWGYVDAGGRVAVEPQYDRAWAFSEGLARVMVGDKIGFIDKLGNMAVAPQYDAQSNRSFSEGLAAVRLDGKWGFIDTTGRMVVKPQYEDAMSLWGGLAAVWVTKWSVGFIDRTGRMVVEPQFVSVGYPHTKGEPYLVIWRHYTKDGGGECGYLDSSGRLLDTPRFEDGESFAEGLARVQLGGKVGFINTKGEFVVEPKFSHAEGWFENGIVRVEDGYKKMFIDKTGRQVAEGVSFFYPRLNVGRMAGFYYDAAGRLLDHYANHMMFGYHYLRVGPPEAARDAFRAALRINPGDEAAMFGLRQAGGEL